MPRDNATSEGGDGLPEDPGYFLERLFASEETSYLPIDDRQHSPSVYSNDRTVIHVHRESSEASNILVAKQVILIKPRMSPHLVTIILPSQKYK